MKKCKTQLTIQLLSLISLLMICAIKTSLKLRYIAVLVVLQILFYKHFNSRYYIILNALQKKRRNQHPKFESGAFKKGTINQSNSIRCHIKMTSRTNGFPNLNFKQRSNGSASAPSVHRPLRYNVIFLIPHCYQATKFYLQKNTL